MNSIMKTPRPSTLMTVHFRVAHSDRAHVNLPEPKMILSLVLKRSIIRKTGRYHGTGGSDSVSGDVILELLKPEPS